MKGKNIRTSTRLAYNIRQFLLVNVPFVLVKNTVAGTTYRLKLSALCDLLESLCCLGSQASEALAKDHFQC